MSQENGKVLYSIGARGHELPLLSFSLGTYFNQGRLGGRIDQREGFIDPGHEVVHLDGRPGMLLGSLGRWLDENRHAAGRPVLEHSAAVLQRLD